MKTIFELVLNYTNGTTSNLLFATKEGAEDELKYCKPGTERTNGIIDRSYILKRTLFK